MKKKLASLLILSLIWSVLFGLTTPAQAAVSKTMRIGLMYGSDTTPSVKLANVEGSGYRFGYYDSSLNFVSLGWTGETSINVLITQNLYLTGSGGYSFTSGSRGAVGCYHVHLPWACEDFDSAYAAAQTVDGGFVAWVEGVYYVRAGSYTRKADAEAAAASLGVEGAGMGETSGYGYSVVAAGTDRILFQFDSNAAGETNAFAVRPGLTDDAPVATTLNGGNKYRGAFRFERINGGSSTVVNMVDLEDYVKGVIPYEMSASWPLEALKAQSVCARTYSIYNTTGRSKHSSHHFDLCTTTDCQVYRGIGSANDHSDQAVNETVGQLACYNGKAIDALYYSSNGGASEDAKTVWGNEFAYLKGKLDPYEADIADIAGNYKWSKSYTAAELKARVISRGYSCGDIVSVTTKQNALGNTVEIKITDAAGKSNTFSRGDSIRGLLNVNSIRFTMTVSGGARQSGGYAVAGASANPSTLDGLYALGGNGEVTALPGQSYIITASGVKTLEPTEETVTSSGETTYTFTGTGWGHNVGLSQWGAYAMAKRGYTYQDILKFYYTGITVE